MRNMQILSPDDIDFSAYERETETRQRVRPAKAYLGEMIERIGQPIVIEGLPLPWAKARDVFRFRPGEMTLWAGVNGHGKSLLTGMVALDLMFAEQRVCIASFEMKPHATLSRMLRQWCGYPPENLAPHKLRDLYEQFAGQADKRLWFYDQQGMVNASRMISVARYCAKELRVQHLVIDNLSKCVRGTDDYNAQKDFVNELTAIARDYGTHIHLVHHIRKLENELKRPDKTDVKGAGEITDQVDNVWLIWRNKADRSTSLDPDAAAICCKQRHGTGWEGGINLWYHAASQQFLETAGAPIINFAERAA